MNARSIPPVLIITFAFASGCQTPEQTGVGVAVAGGALAAGIAKLAGANDTVTVLVGVGTALISGGIAYEIQRQHEATEAQRRAAEEELRLKLASMPPEDAARTPKTWAIPVPPELGQSGQKPEFIRVDRETQQAGSTVDVLDKAPPPGTTTQVEKEAAVYFP